MHGKLITHLTKSSVDAYGNESYDHLHFFYDAQSKPAFVEYRGEMYRYIHNLQGDIVGIVDANGTLVVEYKYDAWGKPVSMTGSLSASLGILNPFRYRGYVWDGETGYHYLRSRYYTSVGCRFINADTVLGKASVLGSHNLFAYCASNPLVRIDSSGYAYTYDAINAYAKPPKSTETFHSKLESKKGLTFSSGLSLSFAPAILMTSVQLGGSIDTQGTVIIQVTRSRGVTTGTMGMAFTTYRGISNAPTVDELNYFGYQLGSSFGFPIYNIPASVGSDVTIIPDHKNEKNYFNVAANTGLGTPGFEVHMMAGGDKTWDIIEFNIVDLGNQIYNSITEWFR